MDDGRFDPAQMRERLLKAGVDCDTLALDATGTIARSASAEDTLPADLQHLPMLANDQLRLRTTLGRGGMGIVRLGDQLALGREVAVKCAMPGDAGTSDADRHRAAAALVQEGRITGALEHPNIVPIHALGRTADGDALLVMKRIEGESWAELLIRRASFHDELERHVEILMEVCRAVHFAHRRGVVHRDLKPANVMVGPFGEVYVLDWGIAVCTGDATIPGATHVRDLTSIAGTPVFMAPEMSMPGETIDARTDVYLLGGVLHVVLTGQPPHDRGPLPEILHAAHVSAPPRFADEVPVELAAICTRALARDPAARFSSADELRTALVAFLRHSGARALVAEARRQLDTLVGALAAKHAGDLEVTRAFSASRFGFEQALLMWSDSPDARSGLRETLVAMTRWEIHRRHADAARVLVHELGDAPLDVVTDLQALEREEQRVADERKALEASVRANDPRFGARARAIAGGVICVVWSVFALLQGAALREGTHAPTAADLGIAYTGLAAAFAIAAIVMRRRRAGALSGRYFAGASASLAVIAWAWFALTPPIHAGIALAHVIFAIGLFMVALFFERRLVLAAIASASGAPLAHAFPTFCFETNVIATFATLAVVVSALRHADQRTIAEP